MKPAGGDEHSPVARRDSDDLRFTIVDGDEAREGRASKRSGRMEGKSMANEVEVGWSKGSERWREDEEGASFKGDNRAGRTQASGRQRAEDYQSLKVGSGGDSRAAGNLDLMRVLAWLLVQLRPRGAPTA